MFFAVYVSVGYYHDHIALMLALDTLHLLDSGTFILTSYLFIIRLSLGTFNTVKFSFFVKFENIVFFFKQCIQKVLSVSVNI